MADKQYNNVRVKHKRDTSANWETNNPVLLYGEIILVDTAAGELRAKIGDGTKTYTQLPFSDEALRSLIEEKVSNVSDNVYTKEEVDDKISAFGIANAFSQIVLIDQVTGDNYYLEMQDGELATYCIEDAVDLIIHTNIYSKIIFADTVNGKNYYVEMRDGRLVSYLVDTESETV